LDARSRHEALAAQRGLHNVAHLAMSAAAGRRRAAARRVTEVVETARQRHKMINAMPSTGRGFTPMPAYIMMC
jgi:hypothetical protein